MPDARILVVDDEENVRHMLELTLRREGYRVTLSADGADALERLRTNPFDLLLCDINMPALDGMRLLGALRPLALHTGVVMMSAYADLDGAMEAIRAGAHDYVAKPFRRAELLFTLRKVEERRRLQFEVDTLRAAALGVDGFQGLLSRSPAMRKIFEQLRRVAPFRSTVLISGESGTGKELVARAIHDTSGRDRHPFIALNCGALPEALAESELFGHAKGTFSDAASAKVGLFEAAHLGTLFLDEVADLSPTLQVKLLRLLQEGEVRRLGESQSRVVDVRVVAASRRPLDELVREGTFREDLYYRLSVVSLHLPPLRERSEDIPLLLEHFVTQIAAKLGRRPPTIAPETMQKLNGYAWPGNVRELEHAVERALLLCEGEELRVDDLPDALVSSTIRGPVWVANDEPSIKRATEQLERLLIQRALEQTGGNRTAAAKLLEISHRALLYKIRAYFPEATDAPSSGED
jgi:two-component system response regulator AtoC